MRTTGSFGAGEFSDPLDPELRSGPVKTLWDLNVEKPDSLEFSKTEQVSGNDREILRDVPRLEYFIWVT